MAGPYSGSYGFLGYALESTFGTFATPTDFVPFAQVAIEKEPGLIEVKAARGTRDIVYALPPGEQKITGAVSFPLFSQMGMGLVVGAIGHDTGVSATTPYTHTIAQQNAMESFTLERNDGLSSIFYTGAMPGKLTIKGSTKTEAQVAVEFTCQSDATSATASTPAYKTDQPFVLAGTTISLFSVADAAVESFELVVDNSPEAHYAYWGKRGPKYVPSMGRLITLKVTLSLQAATYYAHLPAETASGAPDAGVETLTLISGSDQMIITLPQMSITKYSRPMEVGKIVMEDITFQAWLGSGANTMSAVVVSPRSTVY